MRSNRIRKLDQYSKSTLRSSYFYLLNDLQKSDVYFNSASYSFFYLSCFHYILDLLEQLQKFNNASKKSSAPQPDDSGPRKRFTGTAFLFILSLGM